MKVLGNVGSSTRLHGVTTQKTAVLTFISVATSDITYVETWTKIRWRIVVGKLLCRPVANPDQEIRSCGRVQNAFFLPLPPHPTPSKELKVNHPVLSYVAIIIIITIIIMR